MSQRTEEITPDTQKLVKSATSRHLMRVDSPVDEVGLLNSHSNEKMSNSEMKMQVDEQKSQQRADRLAEIASLEAEISVLRLPTDRAATKPNVYDGFSSERSLVDTNQITVQSSTTASRTMEISAPNTSTTDLNAAPQIHLNVARFLAAADMNPLARKLLYKQASTSSTDVQTKPTDSTINTQTISEMSILTSSDTPSAQRPIGRAEKKNLHIQTSPTAEHPNITSSVQKPSNASLAPSSARNLFTSGIRRQVAAAQHIPNSMPSRNLHGGLGYFPEHASYETQTRSRKNSMNSDVNTVGERLYQAAIAQRKRKEAARHAHEAVRAEEAQLLSASPRLIGRQSVHASVIRRRSQTKPIPVHTADGISSSYSPSNASTNRRVNIKALETSQQLYRSSYVFSERQRKRVENADQEAREQAVPVLNRKSLELAEADKQSVLERLYFAPLNKLKSTRSTQNHSSTSHIMPGRRRSNSVDGAFISTNTKNSTVQRKRSASLDGSVQPSLLSTKRSSRANRQQTYQRSGSLEAHADKECTFKPKLSKRSLELASNQSRNQGHGISAFIQRLQSQENRRHKHVHHHTQQSMSDEMAECTFEPNIEKLSNTIHTGLRSSTEKTEKHLTERTQKGSATNRADSGDLEQIASRADWLGEDQENKNENETNSETATSTHQENENATKKDDPLSSDQVNVSSDADSKPTQPQNDSGDTLTAVQRPRSLRRRISIEQANNMYLRSQRWLQQKQAKLREAREEAHDAELDGCTFRPNPEYDEQTPLIRRRSASISSPMTTQSNNNISRRHRRSHSVTSSYSFASSLRLSPSSTPRSKHSITNRQDVYAHIERQRKARILAQFSRQKDFLIDTHPVHTSLLNQSPSSKSSHVQSYASKTPATPKNFFSFSHVPERVSTPKVYSAVGRYSSPRNTHSLSYSQLSNGSAQLTDLTKKITPNKLDKQPTSSISMSSSSPNSVKERIDTEIDQEVTTPGLNQPNAVQQTSYNKKVQHMIHKSLQTNLEQQIVYTETFTAGITTSSYGTEHITNSDVTTSQEANVTPLNNKSLSGLLSPTSISGSFYPDDVATDYNGDIKLHPDSQSMNVLKTRTMLPSSPQIQSCSTSSITNGFIYGETAPLSHVSSNPGTIPTTLVNTPITSHNGVQYNQQNTTVTSEDKTAQESSAYSEREQANSVHISANPSISSHGLDGSTSSSVYMKPSSYHGHREHRQKEPTNTVSFSIETHPSNGTDTRTMTTSMTSHPDNHFRGSYFSQRQQWSSKLQNATVSNDATTNQQNQYSHSQIPPSRNAEAMLERLRQLIDARSKAGQAVQNAVSALQ